MKLRRNVLLGAWLILGAGLLLAFGSVALLTRMTPAIATILEQNDFSVQACEEMLVVLATPPDATGTTDQLSTFRAALGEARRNVTEASERPVLERIVQSYETALAQPDSPERLETIVAIRELTSINRAVMVEADLKAQRMGTAGAWAVVLLASVSLIVSLLFIRHLSERVLAPIGELGRTVQAVQVGEVQRRVSYPGAARDLQNLFTNTNDLLDRLQLAQPRKL